jgi:hypothetical protein
MEDGEGPAIAYLNGWTVLSGRLDQRSAALGPGAVTGEANLASAPRLRRGRRVRLLAGLGGRRPAGLALAVLLSPALAAGMAMSLERRWCFQLPARLAASLGCYGQIACLVRRSRILDALSAARGHRGGAVQLLGDKLAHDLADELANRLAQLGSDDLLERSRQLGHRLSLRRPGERGPRVLPPGVVLGAPPPRAPRCQVRYDPDPSPVHQGPSFRTRPARLTPTLLCCQGRPGHVVEASVEVAGERAFDAAACLPGGLAGGE